MKKSLLAIALVLGTVPAIFAAPANTTQATTQKTKKHVKKGHGTKNSSKKAPASKPSK